MPSIVCRRSHCGTVMIGQFDPIGRLLYHCPKCKRNKAGLCRDCPGRITSRRALRCERCARKQRRARQRIVAHRRYADPRLRERHLAGKRRSYQKPENRARRLAYGKQYRATHKRPRDDADRAYFREWMRNARKDPEFRERVNARRRERARERRAAKQPAKQLLPSTAVAA